MFVLSESLQWHYVIWCYIGQNYDDTQLYSDTKWYLDLIKVYLKWYQIVIMQSCLAQFHNDLSFETLLIEMTLIMSVIAISRVSWEMHWMAGIRCHLIYKDSDEFH